MGYLITILKYTPAAIELVRLGIDLADEAASMWADFESGQRKPKKRKKR
ncbi:MAG: hypothetical protein IPO93_18430 [Actinobacteria bacterium]|jgi:hypothetical protein|nr:hypothetical protein [Actinomycetota bacterium]